MAAIPTHFLLGDAIAVGALDLVAASGIKGSSGMSWSSGVCR
jgi:hypothetical protein